MFSAKNYGLPKELIEAAKRVHEKQLEEQQVPTVKAPKGQNRVRPSDASKETRRAADKNEKEVEMSLKLRKLGDDLKKEREKKRNHPTYIQSRYHKGDTYEEVQFTEEELAEAFAIFLEENFHVDMLTEEDLDYVFEEEFPQWLEESWYDYFFGKSKMKKKKEDPISRRRRQHREIRKQVNTPSWEGDVVPNKKQKHWI